MTTTKVAIPKMTEDEYQAALGILANYLSEELKGEVSPQAILITAYFAAKEMLEAGTAAKTGEVSGKEAVAAAMNANLTEREKSHAKK